MSKFWQWVGSPAYWKLSAIVISLYLGVAALGHTQEWFFSSGVLCGFYFCWEASKRAVLSAHGIKKNT